MAYNDDGSSRMTLRMPESLRDSLEAMAAASNVPVSTFSRQLIEKALEDGTAGSGGAMDRLIEAEAALAEARARHVQAQARRAELENERIEMGMPLPQASPENVGLSLVIVGDGHRAGVVPSLPSFGNGPGQRPYRELPHGSAQ